MRRRRLVIEHKAVRRRQVTIIGRLDMDHYSPSEKR
jgi:hypothetical protein